jgi:large subunit ribosomal protein L22
MPETTARLRYYPTSPTKVREVLGLIVGKDVGDAREVLRFCSRGPAETVMKVLDSAVANAEHNDHVAEEELFVTRAFADEGPTMKRGRPRARGRYGRLKKRTTHLTIVVARLEEDELERRRRREAAAGAPARVSRRRRVAASRRRSEAAPEHDHDHDEETVEPLDESVEAVTDVEVDDAVADEDALVEEAETEDDEAGAEDDEAGAEDDEAGAELDEAEDHEHDEADTEVDEDEKEGSA